MAAAASDRLSALPDNLLHHILSFTPVREAAASAILSRRWRPLWRSTSVLNLDSRPYFYVRRAGACSDPFFRDARAALAAFHHRATALKRLSLSVTEDAYLVGGGMYRYDSPPYVKPEYDPRVAGLLADPAAAELEELRVEGQGSHGELYAPPLASLPCAATMLRVLELDSCTLEPSPAPSAARLAFPRLTDLTLRNCCYVEWSLQDVIDAAPALTSLALVDVTNKSPEPQEEYMTAESFNLPLRVRCPTVTDLVLVTNVCWVEHEESRAIGIQLDMPSLRSFRYKGFPVKLSLISPAPGLARVDFDATIRESCTWEPPARMLASFSSTRALKLHINAIEEIVDVEEQHGQEEAILPTFPNLKLLEVDGKLFQRDMTLGMATLFRCCPAMAELRLRLNSHDYCYYDRNDPAGGPFAQSMERFNRLAGMPSAHRDIMELGGVSELPDDFTNNCSLSCLRKVTLQFESKEFNCFQVQLAKFLVENAMVLEEMYIDNGSQFWTDHLCHKVARWRADSFRRRNLPPDTAGFRVYQLATPAVGSDEPRLL